MGTSTKIVVLHSKKLIWGAILVFALLCAMILFFNIPKDHQSEAVTDLSQAIYEAGVYSSVFSLGENQMEISVYLDSDHINGISMTYLDDYVETMYPLMQPTFQDLTSQIIATQTISEVTYPMEQKYTSMALLKEIYQTLQLGEKK